MANLMSIGKGEKQKTGRYWAFLQGIVSLFISGILGKGLSLLVQIALGWMLTQEEFGLWAIVVSVSGIVAILRNGGTSPLLVQRGQEYGKIVGEFFSYSLFFNLLAMLLLLISAPAIGLLYQSTLLVYMLCVVALELPLGTVYALLRARACIDKDFKLISHVSVVSSVIRQAMTVLLAYLGFGAFSFVIPILFETVCSTILFYRWIPGIRFPALLTWSKAQQMFRDTRWVMLGALFIGLAWQGDYIVVGLLESSAQLGVYFFSMQLVSSVAIVFSMTSETILLPMLAPLASSRDLLAARFLSSVSLVGLTTFPVVCVGYILAEPLVGTLWGGRWDDAIDSLEVLLMTVPAWLMLSVARSLLEARGLWRARLLYTALFSLGSMFAAGVGAWIGGIFSVAVCVTIFRSLYGVAQLWIVGRDMGISIANTSMTLFRPLVLVGFSVLAAYIVIWSLHQSVSHEIGSVLFAMIFIFFYSVFALVATRKQVMKLLHSRREKRRQDLL